MSTHSLARSVVPLVASAQPLFFRPAFTHEDTQTPGLYVRDLSDEVIKLIGNDTFYSQQIVNRARARLGERTYNVLNACLWTLYTAFWVALLQEYEDFSPIIIHRENLGEIERQFIGGDNMCPVPNTVDKLYVPFAGLILLHCLTAAFITEFVEVNRYRKSRDGMLLTAADIQLAHDKFTLVDVNKMNLSQFSELMKTGIVASRFLSQNLNPFFRRVVYDVSTIKNMGFYNFTKMCFESSQMLEMVNQYPDVLEVFKEHLPEHLVTHRVLLNQLLIAHHKPEKTECVIEEISEAPSSSSIAGTSNPSSEMLTIVFSDGQTAEFESDFLTQQSGYFALCKKYRDISVQKEDVTHDIFMNMIYALNTPEFINEENVITIYLMALKYDVKSLVLTCVVFLASSVERVKILDEDFYTLDPYKPLWDDTVESKNALKSIYSHFVETAYASNNLKHAIQRIDAFARHFSIKDALVILQESLLYKVVSEVEVLNLHFVRLQQIAKIVSISSILHSSQVREKVESKILSALEKKRVSSTSTHEANPHPYFHPFHQCWAYAVEYDNLPFKQLLAKLCLTRKGQKNLMESQMRMGWMDLPEELENLIRAVNQVPL